MEKAAKCPPILDEGNCLAAMITKYRDALCPPRPGKAHLGVSVAKIRLPPAMKAPMKKAKTKEVVRKTYQRVRVTEVQRHLFVPTEAANSLWSVIGGQWRTWRKGQWMTVDKQPWMQKTSVKNRREVAVDAKERR